ncbi:glycosyltransferase family 9 protein [bacterium]|nr:MAG: glycosyltransferase family 9 protein [bacterium]
MYKILVFSMTRMGDIIQSIPFFRRLRKKHPHAQVDLLVESCFSDVAGFLPGIDNIIEVRLEDLLLCFDRKRGADFPSGITYYRKLVDSLRRSGYGEVWNLTHTKPFTVLSALVGGEHANGVTLDDNGLQKVNKAWLKYFYATNLSRPWCQFNLVDIYANCIDGIPQDFGRSIKIAPQRYRDRYPQGYNPKYDSKRIAIHPGASQAAKMWPLAKYIDVAKRLSDSGREIVIIGGKSDRALGEQIARQCKAINLVGKTSIPELAAVLEDCDLLISNDSGPMHMAAAVGTQVIAITLGSALGSETAPYGTDHWVIEPRVECFPCSAEKVCGRRNCADHISANHLIELVEACLLKRPLSAWMQNDTRIRLYKTARDKDNGQLRLLRCGDDSDDIRESRNRLFRTLWPIWLENASPGERDYTPIDSGFRSVIEEILCETRKAVKLCVRLAGCSPHSKESWTRIEILHGELNQVDRKLNRLLASVDVLKSVLAYLMIEKGSVGGHTLQEQARQTAQVYSDLTRMLSASLPEGPQTESQKKEDKEVCYENLPEWS